MEIQSWTLLCRHGGDFPLVFNTNVFWSSDHANSESPPNSSISSSSTNLQKSSRALGDRFFAFAENGNPGTHYSSTYATFLSSRSLTRLFTYTPCPFSLSFSFQDEGWIPFTVDSPSCAVFEKGGGRLRNQSLKGYGEGVIDFGVGDD